MDETTRGIDVSLPFTWHEVGVFGVVLGLILLSALVYATLPNADHKAKPIDLLGRMPMPRPIASLVLTVVGALFIVALAATLTVLWNTLSNPSTANGLGVGTLIAATLGAPFLIWRTVVAQRTLNISEESLFNDKINAAATGLSARHQVTRSVHNDTGYETILTEWRDDLVTRAAAIDRLEGLANEKPDETPRIARMLSVYVRELSAEHPALTNPRTRWLELSRTTADGPGLDAETIFRDHGIHPDDATPEAISNWARELKPVRSDIEKAAQTLGRLKAIRDVESSKVVIDLRESNLRGLDLCGLNFRDGRFEGAALEGAELQDTNLESANLDRAHLEGANLSAASLRGAYLNDARFEGATLEYANLEWAMLFGTHLDGADFDEARFEGAVLTGTSLKEASLEGANLSRSNLDSAHFEGSDLQGANFEGAIINRIHLNQGTDLRNANLRGAALRFIDAVTAVRLAPFLKDTFADGSVKLPINMTRPPHWVSEPLGIDFHSNWHVWQATLDPPLS